MTKKLIFTLIAFAFTNSLFAQIDLNLLEAQKKSVLDAVKKTDEYVLKAPTKSRIWLDRAIAYFDLASFPDSTVALKDPEASFKALEYISEAIKLDTRDGEKGEIANEAEVLISRNNKSKAYYAFMNMAVIKYNNQDYFNSYKFLNKANEILPNDTLTINWKGKISLLCDKQDEAIKAFESYLNFGGKELKSLYLLTQLYILNNQDQKAEDLKTKIISIYGKDKWELEDNPELVNSEQKKNDKINSNEKDIDKQNSKTEKAEEKKGFAVVAKENVSPKAEEKKDVASLTAIKKSISLVPFKLKNGFYHLASKSSGAIVDNNDYDEVIPT
jgi:hypothetical protein